MSSSSLESDSTTSSSSDDSLMMSKQLLDELMVDENSSSKATYEIVPTIATQVPITLSQRDFTLLVSRIVSRMKQVQDKRIHQDLKADLINHLWDVYGDHQAT
ncbi:tryptophan synthase beta chain [Striga asiatica]|uniref:Tryptophan synthase beta chain n=1 Tax=Striga asiatica TaxID=4170 RepID=A0A5A7PWT7_STRAF|nr:tryptophan synthase beta chain [Striga asiatica]